MGPRFVELPAGSAARDRPEPSRRPPSRGARTRSRTLRRCTFSLTATLVATLLIACTPEPTPGPSQTPTQPVSEATTPSPIAFPAPFPTDRLAETSDSPLPQATAERLQAALDGALRAGGGSGGFSAAVLRADGSWSGAAGIAAGERAMRPQDQMHLGSLTQPVVAAQIMGLAEQGLLDINAPVHDYLPHDLDFDTNDATVAELLGMRSGIPNLEGAAGFSILVRADRQRRWTPEEVLELVNERRTEPGGPAALSATNYLLLGLVVEHLTGRPLAEALRDDVLDFPGLERMIVQPVESPSEPVALPVGAGLPSEEVLAAGGGYLPSLSEVSALGGAGAMAADAVSLARWWQLLCGGHVVSRTSLTEMATFGHRRDYGLGLVNLTVRMDTPAVGGFSYGPGYAGFAACLPTEGVVVAMLTNHNAALTIFGVTDSLVDAARPDT